MTFTLILVSLCILFLIFMNAFLAHKQALRDAEVKFVQKKMADAELLAVLLNNRLIPCTKTLRFLLCKAINRKAVDVLNYQPENQAAINLAQMSVGIFKSFEDNIDEKQDGRHLENFTMPTSTKEVELFREYIRLLRRFLRHEMKLTTIATCKIKNEIKTINFLQVMFNINEYLQNAKALSSQNTPPINNIYIDNIERLLNSSHLSEHPSYSDRIRAEINTIKQKWEESINRVSCDNISDSPHVPETKKLPHSASNGLDRMLDDGVKPKWT